MARLLMEEFTDPSKLLNAARDDRGCRGIRASAIPVR